MNFYLQHITTQSDNLCYQNQDSDKPQNTQSDNLRMVILKPENIPKMSSSKKSSLANAEERPSKIKFKDYITLTQDQYDKLLKLHGKVQLDVMLEILENYKASSGRKYKSDYHVLLEHGWVALRYKQEQRNSWGQNGNTTKQNIRKRQLDEWIRDNGNPDDNPHILRFE